MKNDTIEAKKILAGVQGKAKLAEDEAKVARKKYDEDTKVLQQEIKDEVKKAADEIKGL